MDQDTRFLMHIRFEEPGDASRALRARGFRATALLCLSEHEIVAVAWGTELDATSWFLEANSALQAYTIIQPEEKTDDDDSKTTPQSER